VRGARAVIGREGWAAAILGQQQDPGHWETFRDGGGDLYRPKYIATNWRLLVLSDLGMTREEPRIGRAVDLLLRHWSGDDGVFGEPGSEVCITGNAARAFTRFGYAEDERVRRSHAWLVGAQKPDGGWHCFPSESGTLDAWEALAAFAALPRERRSPEIQRSVDRGLEFYLERRLMDEGEPPYAPCRRFHYPVHYYYDVLVGLDIVTALGRGEDPRLRPALEWLEGRRNRDGSWNLDVLHPDLEDPEYLKDRRTPFFPFGLEFPGHPSRWITTTALLVLRRTGRL
jgi:hypothetical protein